MITMAHTAITDPAGEVAMQPGAVASKVVLRAHGLNVTVFGSTPAASLSEHQAARAAVVEVLSWTTSLHRRRRTARPCRPPYLPGRPPTCQMAGS